MEKPISLTLREAKENIVAAINSEALPPSILVLLMKDIMNEIIAVDREVYERDLADYKEKLKQEESNGEHSGIPTGD